MSGLLVVLLSVPSMLLPLATRPSHTTARMMCTAPPEIPVKLLCVGAGTTGVEFELFPQLQKKFTAEELDTIAENAMCCLGDHWMMPECGSALWVLYKRVCDKDLDKLAEALLPENVAESREQIKRHMCEGGGDDGSPAGAFSRAVNWC